MLHLADPHRDNQGLYRRWTGVPFALAYGLITHLVFQPNDDYCGLVSLGFLVGVPFVLGLITMLLARSQCDKDFVEPLVTKQRGGSVGGGARLTATGEQVLRSTGRSKRTPASPPRAACPNCWN